MAFFELRTPRDMLAKAHREYDRLLSNFNIDNLFNFFVTANHIRDYVQKSKAIPPTVLNRFLEDTDLKDCRDLCDKGKHLTLTKRLDPTTSIMSGCYGGAPFGAMPYGGGTIWLLNTDKRSVNVQQLANRIVSKWTFSLQQTACNRLPSVNYALKRTAAAVAVDLLGTAAAAA